MATLPEHINRALERLNRVYFRDSGRILELAAGERLLTQGEPCRRIYLVLEGELVAYRSFDTLEGTSVPAEDTVGRGHEVFRVGVDSYVGVQSFFSGSFHSNNHIFALSETRLAYIDDTTEVIDEAEHGSLEHQFLPIVVHELVVRNSRILGHAAEKEEAMRLVQRSELAAMLGQLSAGIAHELNNAVGVITRRTEFVANMLTEHLEEEDKRNARLFRLGYEESSLVNAGEHRKLARKYERELNMGQEAAKVLAHIIPDTETLKKYGPEFVMHVKRNYQFWELGHDLRDMQLAARHATGIVRAVKLLGGAGSTRQEGVDVLDTVRDAVTLLSNKVKHVTLTTTLTPLPLITADITELVQVWSNIISNACDAMAQGGTVNPAISIVTELHHAEGVSLLPTEYIRVSISNNGPEIPEDIREKIFQPNFTTKKLGLDFGLGLGLSIVRRVVDSYNGTIELSSSPELTTFTINIPTTPIHGND